MEFLTTDKLVIVGAGGAIGSTMVQTALTMKLTPNVCLYDVYAPGMEKCSTVVMTVSISPLPLT